MFEYFYKVGDLMMLKPMYQSDTSYYRIPANSLVLITKNCSTNPSSFKGRVVYPIDSKGEERNFSDCHFDRVSMVPVAEDSIYRDIYEMYLEGKA